MNDNFTTSINADFAKNSSPQEPGNGIDVPSKSCLYRMFNYLQHNLSWNAQRSLLLLLILLQAVFFTWYTIDQRNAIEDNAARVLRNTALLEAQQFETSMDAMGYQMQVIGNAILLNKTVSAKNEQNILQQELNQEWLDQVIVFDANGDFVASAGSFPEEQTLTARTISQRSFSEAPLFIKFRRENIDKSLHYWKNPNSTSQQFSGFIMYRAVRDAAGNYLGGTMGYFKSASMGNLFIKMEQQGFSLGPGGVIAVLERETGALFARIGAGTDAHYLKNTNELLEKYSSDTAKVHRYVSPVDGKTRLGVFLNLNERKWVLVVGLAEYDVLGSWYIQTLLTFLGVLSIAILQWLLLYYMHDNFLQREHLAREARQDPLTGLANRRRFDEWAKSCCSLVRRHQKTLCLLALDLDHFKDINDRYGHDAGDVVLKSVGKILQDSLRESDIAARFGGEEFVIALSHVDLDTATTVAERLRTSLAALVVIHQEQTIRFTVSVGVSQMTAEELAMSDGIHSALARADQALYRSKHEGRNCVNLAQEA